MMSHKKNTNKSNQRPKRVRAQTKSRIERHGSMHEVVVSPRGMPLPSRMRCNLRLEATQALNRGGAASNANVRFIPTFCYDVDPTLGSTSMPFFTEMVGLYRYYRCISSSCKASFVNLEAFPAFCCVCPVNFDPAANTSSFENYFSSRVSQTKPVGALTGNGIVSIGNSATTDSFAGSKWTYTQDAYCASGSSSPANNWYWFVGVYAASNFSNGVNVYCIVDIEVEFFELSSPSA
jgi:hypothetical protein